MGSKNKFNKIEFVSVGTSAIQIAEHPSKNKPESYLLILQDILNRVWITRRRNTRNIRPHQLTMALNKDRVLCVLFYSGRGTHAVFAHDMFFFALLKDSSSYLKDYTSELQFFVDSQIPELAFIAATLRYSQYFLPKIHSAIRLNNNQARIEKIKVIRTQILNRCSPIVLDLFKSKFSSYSIYSYHSYEPPRLYRI